MTDEEKLLQNCDVIEDFNLGEWIQTVSEYTVEHKRDYTIRKKDSAAADLIWNENYKRLYEAYMKYDCDMELAFQNLDNDTKAYFTRQRYKYKKGSLNLNRIKELNDINYDWGPFETKLLNKTIEFGAEYNRVYRKCMLERMKYILRDLSFEIDGSINNHEDQEKIEQQIIKRMWR